MNKVRSNNMRILIGITGASGIGYALDLLSALNTMDGAGKEDRNMGIGDKNIPGEIEIHLILSDSAIHVLRAETDTSPDDLRSLASYVYDNDDFSQKVCSGSSLFDAMVVIPCTMSTLAKLANGIADNVITRAGAVTLKERRRLIVVPRETPLSTIHLKNMYELSLAGAIIVPAMPGFYNSPTDISDMQKFMTGRILDLLGLPNNASPRWDGKKKMD